MCSIVHRVWASARMGQLDGWFKSWVPDSVFGGGVVVFWRLGILLLLVLRKFLLVLLIPMFIFIVADVIKSSDTDCTILDRVLSCLGFAWLVSSCFF